MKKVLFIGATNYNFKKLSPLHLKEKFLGLSKEIKPYILARGSPFYKRIWNTEFYLLPPTVFYWFFAFFIAFYLCLFKKIDTIVAQSPLMEGLVGSILKKLLKKELIVEIHGDWVEGPFLSRKRKLEFLEKRFIPFIAKLSFKSADKIRGVANYLIKKAKEIAPGKQYFLFHTFTDIDRFLEEKDIVFEDYILFVGGLERVKGIRYLIEAFAEIVKESPQFKLIIVGEGSERKNLESLISNLEHRTSNIKLKDSIVFKGRLSLHDTRNIMKKCYCLVLPSLSEGLPRVLIEAMALGKPVIASKVGGIPEIVKEGENGFLFKKGDSNELSEKLKILLSNREIALKMGERGRRFVKKNFSNEKYISHYISMIKAG